MINLGNPRERKRKIRRRSHLRSLISMKTTTTLLTTKNRLPNLNPPKNRSQSRRQSRTRSNPAANPFPSRKAKSRKSNLHPRKLQNHQKFNKNRKKRRLKTPTMTLKVMWIRNLWSPGRPNPPLMRGIHCASSMRPSTGRTLRVWWPRSTA